MASGAFSFWLCLQIMTVCLDRAQYSTYDHRSRRTGHPVRSAVHEP